MKFQPNPIFPDATKEQKMEQLRLWRNAKLFASDWTMIEDATTDKKAWREYRKALRDLPSQSNIAEEIELPTEPSL
jgi:hypothetical protein